MENKFAEGSCLNREAILGGGDRKVSLLKGAAAVAAPKSEQVNVAPALSLRVHKAREESLEFSSRLVGVEMIPSSGSISYVILDVNPQNPESINGTLDINQPLSTASACMVRVADADSPWYYEAVQCSEVDGNCLFPPEFINKLHKGTNFVVLASTISYETAAHMAKEDRSLAINAALESMDELFDLLKCISEKREEMIENFKASDVEPDVARDLIERYLECVIKKAMAELDKRYGEADKIRVYKCLGSSDAANYVFTLQSARCISCDGEIPNPKMNLCRCCRTPIPTLLVGGMPKGKGKVGDAVGATRREMRKRAGRHAVQSVGNPSLEEMEAHLSIGAIAAICYSQPFGECSNSLVPLNVNMPGHNVFSIVTASIQIDSNTTYAIIGTTPFPELCLMDATYSVSGNFKHALTAATTNALNYPQGSYNGSELYYTTAPSTLSTLVDNYAYVTAGFRLYLTQNLLSAQGLCSIYCVPLHDVIPGYHTFYDITVANNDRLWPLIMGLTKGQLLGGLASKSFVYERFTISKIAQSGYIECWFPVTGADAFAPRTLYGTNSSKYGENYNGTAAYLSNSSVTDATGAVQGGTMFIPGKGMCMFFIAFEGCASNGSAYTIGTIEWICKYHATKGSNPTSSGAAMNPCDNYGSIDVSLLGMDKFLSRVKPSTSVIRSTPYNPEAHESASLITQQPKNHHTTAKSSATWYSKAWKNAKSAYTTVDKISKELLGDGAGLAETMATVIGEGMGYAEMVAPFLGLL